MNISKHPWLGFAALACSAGGAIVGTQCKENRQVLIGKGMHWGSMSLRRVLVGTVFVVGMVAAGAASATVVSVNGTAGPWDPTIASNPAYGVGDQTAPTVVAVNAGDNITITYLSGFTSAFGTVSPSVDALGYTFLPFGSGADGAGTCPFLGCTGVGSSGQPFPSFSIDPTNTGLQQIALNALIGAFVNSSGVILDEFAPGDGPFSIVAPVGAVALQLGINDDIFTNGTGTTNAGTFSVPVSPTPDNSGALSIKVDGSTAAATAVPEPASLALFGTALAGLGLLRRRRRDGESGIC